MPRTPWSMLLGGLLAASSATPGRTDDAPLPTGVFVVTDELIADRLRVFGRPGDLALRNGAATAIVRKSDGWLVDFWPNDPTPPTAPQLRQLTAVDGLWLLHPIVHDGKVPVYPAAREVRAAGDAIETIADVGLGAGKVQVITSYRLDGERPRLIITTRFVHRSGGKVAHLSLGDEVKWGNVDYFVQGHGRVPGRFSGVARWVGRKGACGDLKLETLEPHPMRVHYKELQHGLAPAIQTAYLGTTIHPKESFVVQRALSYETIDAPAQAQKRSGTLEVIVTDEAGRPLASKLGFRGHAGTSDPDFGNDGDETGANRFVWSGVGRFSRTLPVGTYKVLATAGIERDARHWTVTIEQDTTHSLEAALPRVIDTPGWLSADLHLHQAASVDSDIACSTRVVAIAAEGVELAAATDHYATFDLAPTVEALVESGALATPVRTIVGTEVSTVGNRFGHFNLYPLAPGTEVPYTDLKPKTLFAAMRAAAPTGVIQVNHPRWDQLGYFHRFKLDPDSGRVPSTLRAEFDDSFDVIEVFNGVDVVSEPKLRQNLFDWIHLLGRGRRYAATGNSDSHKLFFVDPGVARNFIHHGPASSDADDLAADESSVIAAIKAGRISVTTGPILEVDVNGKGPGETVTGTGKKLPLHVRVRAAPFIDVSEVEVLVGEKGRRSRWIAIKNASGVVRLDTTIELVVPGKTFVVVVAKGKRDMPNTFSPSIRPIAFTNPIWIEP